MFRDLFLFDINIMSCYIYKIKDCSFFGKEKNEKIKRGQNKLKFFVFLFILSRHFSIDRYLFFDFTLETRI